MLKTILTFIVSLFMSTNTFGYFSSDGDEFTAQYNEHGAILTSTADKYFTVGSGAGTKWVPEKIIIYLGGNCDAHSDRYGEGSWAWANGGFEISFVSGIYLGFARQDIHIENDGGCMM